MYQHKITMYKIGAFSLSWDEDSTTLKGEPTVVSRVAYRGGLRDVARMADEKFGGNLSDVVAGAYDKVKSIKSPSMGDESYRINKYSGITWAGQELIEVKSGNRKGETYWKDVMWSTHDGAATWLFNAFLPQDEPMTPEEALEAIRVSVTKFESLVV